MFRQSLAPILYRKYSGYLNIMKDYQQLDASVAHSAEMLEQALPAVLQPFQDMAKSAKGEGAIPHQSRLLIALGIAISTHCDPCIARHARKLAECGASRKKSPKSPVFVSA
jgi:AhpD family alkylhydroperoxidase